MDEKPKRRWFRFRLSTVLILTAIAAWVMACKPYMDWGHDGGPDIFDDESSSSVSVFASLDRLHDLDPFGDDGADANNAYA